MEAADKERFTKFLEQMHKHEAVFWSIGDDGDQISLCVRKAVEKMKEITRKAVQPIKPRT